MDGFTFYIQFDEDFKAAIKVFIDINGRAPRYAVTAYGRVSFTNLVLGYSRIMGFYGRNGRLPAYLIL